ncbi:hypothetical protein T12_13727 [Trichinella patagoniensis]|uniref:DUF5641 domain-containing protein n=1 Tax=Trichinella patagoniensis TaxID=990121 RepID=A0A0V0Z3V2_9BILA|nr:hypothetical protein T12_13727 [Trichinella patagoniensis]
MSVVKDEDKWVPKTQSTPQLMKNWKFRQRLIVEWWKRWKSDNALRIGDIVLVSESNVPRRNWKLGKLYPGQDGIVRTMKLHLASGFVNRPISKLHLIELAEVQ